MTDENIVKMAADVVNSYFANNDNEEIFNDKMIELSNLLVKEKPQLVKNCEDFSIVVSWKMTTNISVRAENLEEAKKLAFFKVMQTNDFVEDLPAEYLDGSLTVEGEAETP